MKGKRINKDFENQCYEVGSDGTIFNHPRNQVEEREAFERYLFKHLQPYWEKLPKPLATLHRAYVREYLETYRIKATRKYYKGS